MVLALWGITLTGMMGVVLVAWLLGRMAGV
jgi:hypothetical protein